MKMWKVYRQTVRQKDGRTDGQTKDNRRSEKLTWAFSLGELKMKLSSFPLEYTGNQTLANVSYHVVIFHFHVLNLPHQKAVQHLTWKGLHIYRYKNSSVKHNICISKATKLPRNHCKTRKWLLISWSSFLLFIRIISRFTSRVWPFSSGPWPTVIFLKNLSFVSITENNILPLLSRHHIRKRVNFLTSIYTLLI